MSEQKGTHSVRFTRAARAESERLQRRQRQASDHVHRIEAELARAQAELTKITDRLEVLRRITNEQPLLEPAPSQGERQTLLRGAEIRRVAVEVLRNSRDDGAPIHYRNWLDLLKSKGYAVAGKRPDAVFLGQIVRSPVIRATTKAGFYELDGEAPRRIASQIAAIELEMSELSASTPRDPERMEENIERQQILSAELRRAQKALKEALGALREPEVRLAA